MNGLTRTIGRIAAVGAVALLLAGSWTAPAAARPRIPPGGTDAGALYTLCVSIGGDPYSFEFMGVWAVGCEMPVIVLTGTE